MSRMIGLSNTLASLMMTGLALPGLLSAQQRTLQEADLPAVAAEDIVAFFNDPGTFRFNGRSGVPEGRFIVGDVGVLGGPFLVAGEIQGDLVVVNGDVRFTESGRVDGDMIVVGGDILDARTGSVTGTTVVYSERLRYSERQGRISYREPRPIGERGGFFLGRSRFTLRSAGSYNRVEGLPVLFGPVIDSRGPNGTRIEAMGLWRSESGLALNDDEMGYLFRLEQRFGTRPSLAFGGGLSSMINPISDLGLSSIESSLSTFFFHKDYRDYFEQEGWHAFASIDMEPFPLALRVEYRDEDHRFVPVSSPWTLRKNDDPWRAQPLIAEGDLQTLSGELTIDDRNDPEHPSDGWYAQARLTRGMDGALFLPEVSTLDGLGFVIPARPVEHRFTTVFVDLRRYNRVSPDAALNFRAVYGGAIHGASVPPQFQIALGGEGTLPGYPLMSIDCGARGSQFQIQRVAFDDNTEGTQPVFPSYGCDRAALFQIEYRGRLGFNLDFGPDDDDDWARDWGWYPLVDLDPTWVAFFDLGRGWSESDPMLDTTTFSDLGLGLFLGDIGLYWAYPLEGEDRGVNFFIRLQRRF